MTALAAASNGQFLGFSTNLVTQIGSIASTPVDLVGGDIDGDGTNDLVFLTQSGRVVAFMGDPVVGLDGNERLLTKPNVDGRAIALHDVDEDGDLDLLRVVASDGGELRYYSNDGSGNYTFEFGVIGLGVIDAFKGVDAADFDADGDDDFFVLTNAGVSVIRNISGQFAPSPIVSQFPAFQGLLLAVEDYNMDGRFDIAAYNSVGENIVVAFSDGVTLNEIQRVSIGENANDLKAVDIDLDGDPDLITCGDSSSDIIRVYRNTSAFFAEAFNLEEADPDEIEIVDLDGDTDLDIVVESQASPATTERAIVYTNNGSGFYTRNPQEWFFATSSVSEIEMVDIFQTSGFDLVGMTGSVATTARASLRQNLSPVVIPGEFLLTSPSNGASGLPLPDSIGNWGGASMAVAQWTNAVGLGVEYEISIATDQGLSNIVASISGIEGFSVELSEVSLLPGVTYFWDVIASNTAGQTLSANGPFSFTTASVMSDCPADQNFDGFLSPADFGAWITNFNAGCP